MPSADVWVSIAHRRSFVACVGNMCRMVKIRIRQPSEAMRPRSGHAIDHLLIQTTGPLLRDDRSLHESSASQ
jgi:hypothetical protein